MKEYVYETFNYGDSISNCGLVIYNFDEFTNLKFVTGFLWIFQYKLTDIVFSFVQIWRVLLPSFKPKPFEASSPWRTLSLPSDWEMIRRPSCAKLSPSPEGGHSCSVICIEKLTILLSIIDERTVYCSLAIAASAGSERPTWKTIDPYRLKFLSFVGHLCISGTSVTTITPRTNTFL